MSIGSKFSLKKTPKLNPILNNPKDGEVENKADASEEIGTDEYTSADVDKAWESFSTFRKSVAAGESELMMLRQGYSFENGVITLNLGNSVQHDIFNRVQTDLHMHLRKALNNKNITVVTHMIEDEEVEMLYTNREKFEFMANKNPLLRELQERLGLDPDI